MIDFALALQHAAIAAAHQAWHEVGAHSAAAEKVTQIAHNFGALR